MSTSEGSVVVQPVPASAKKIVQSLKEVVHCVSETEIYATLNDCNMDPDEAVGRLLSQDPFHEVKSKREKKKEGKDTDEYRPRGANSSSSRGVKSVSEPYLGHGGSAPYFSSESGLIQRKYIYRKKTEATPYTCSLPSAPSTSGININSGTAGLSDHTSAENTGPSSVGGPGQLSMADVVKMGRQHNKVAVSHDGSYNIEGSSGFPDSNISEVQDMWPSIEKPVASVLVPVHEITVDSHVPSEDLVMHCNGEYQDYEANKDEATGENKDFVAFHSISSREFPDDDSRCGSQYENNLQSNMGSSYLPQARDFDLHEVNEGDVSVSSVTINMKQLNVESDERGYPSEGEADAPLIIQFPDHLKVNSADFSHLSFGNFHAGISIPCSSSGAVTSPPVETSIVKRHGAVNIPAVSHPDTRLSEYCGGNSFRIAANGTLYDRTGSRDESSAPQLKPPKDAGVLDYHLLSSIHDYSDDNLRLLNAAISKLNAKMQDQAPFSNDMLQRHENADVFEYHTPSFVPDYSGGNGLPQKTAWGGDPRRLYAAISQMNFKMQNQSPFSSDMSYPSSSLPSMSLGANVQPKHSRESELEYLSRFNITPEMAAKYGLPASAIGGSTNSMSEPLKTPGLPSMQPATHNLLGPGASTGGLSLQQNRALDPYWQRTHPSDPYAMIGGYPSLPQSSVCMPSDFQQEMTNNSPYHQSLAAAVHAKCDINPSAVNVPRKADIAPRYGYGGPVNEGTISGNFSLKQPNTLSGRNSNYNNVLSSQYKDSLLISLQQNENSSMWPHDQGSLSRTISAVPSSTFRDHLGQGQEPGGFRQSRQTSSTYGLQGYQSYYHSQQIPRYEGQDWSQGQERQY